MKPMKMLLAAASLLFACQAGAADGILGWNTTKKDWVKIRASASGFMFSGQDANDYITLYSATTATTGAKPVQALPVGAYRVRATVTGSGAVSGTIEVYCNNTEANTGGTQQSTDIVLSDTDADTDVLAADITTACPYIYVEVDAVSASSALNIVAIPIYSAATAAGSSSTSPAYVTIVDSSGDSAVDATANAVKVLNYVSENNTSGTSTDVAATALGVGGAGVELIDGYDLGAIGATYCTLAITNSADGAIDAAKIYLLPSGETNLTAPNVLGGSTGVTSAHFTAPAVGSPLEWATTWVTSTGVIGDGDLTDLAASSVWVGRLKVAGADKLYVEISGDGAVDTTYRLSCN